MSVSDTVKILDALETLRDACHQNSKDKGFWQYGEGVPWNFGEKIALIHSELSEMFEAWRKNVKQSEKDIKIVEYVGYDQRAEQRQITAIEEEVADVFIRIFDLCGKLGIPVGQVVLAKMEYNKGRPMMHGGRKC